MRVPKNRIILTSASVFIKNLGIDLIHEFLYGWLVGYMWFHDDKCLEERVVP